MEGMVTEGNGAEKVHNALGCPKFDLPSMQFCLLPKFEYTAKIILLKQLISFFGAY